MAQKAVDDLTESEETEWPWLDCFIDEKNLDPNHVIKVDDPREGVGHVHLVENGVVFDAMRSTVMDEKQRIKDTLVKIDFNNGKVQPFLDHLAEGYIKNRVIV